MIKLTKLEKNWKKINKLDKIRELDKIEPNQKLG